MPDSPVPIIGVTGGIGSGKSAATATFESLGIRVVDDDIVAREVVAKGMPALEAISQHFGKEILLGNGELNRNALRERIFAKAHEKKWLEALLHPQIRQSIIEQLQQAPSAYVILASPLLFETQQDQLVDQTLLIDCCESLQEQRAMARDGATKESIKAIMASQLSRQARIDKADTVIDNSGKLEALKAAIIHYHQEQLKTINS